MRANADFPIKCTSKPPQARYTVDQPKSQTVVSSTRVCQRRQLGIPAASSGNFPVTCFTMLNHAAEGGVVCVACDPLSDQARSTLDFCT